MNQRDRAGTLMAIMVWILMAYSVLTILLLAQNHHLAITIASLHCTLVTLALASHAKTTLTDPGSVPSSAVPIFTKGVKFHAMCSVCQTYKPDKCHHCRICNRCISGMDHHCPWMNNCIGAANMKHFILFLVYTWTACALALMVFLLNYFFCSSTQCEFRAVEIILVRAMASISVPTLIFTSSMLMNVVFAVLTGATTIDRLKMKMDDTWNESTLEPVPLVDIFGIGPRWTWIFPVDPVFQDYDRIMGYATRQRLLRQKHDGGTAANDRLALAQRHRIDV
jgi:hypothetical protein